MIEQIEHPEPQLHGVLLPVKGQSEVLEHLKVKRIKSWESLIVSRTDEITLFVHHGIWKSGVNIQDWHEHHLPRPVKLPPCQEAVGCIEGQRTARVGLDYGLGIVSEELVEVVEVASGLRPHVGGIQSLSVYLVLASELKLAIKIPPRAGQRQEAVPGSFFGI